MNYNNFESDSSDSSRSSKSSGEDHLSLQYGMSSDDETEHSRGFEVVDVDKPYSETGSATEVEDDYDDEDIRSVTKKPKMQFDWTVLKEKRNLKKIGYCLVGFIGFIIIVSTSASASKKRKAKRAAANQTPSEFVDPSGYYDDVYATVEPTVMETTGYTSEFSVTSSGTIHPTNYWWNEPFDDDGMGNSTEVPFTGTEFPAPNFWWNDPNALPWWATGNPTAWTSTMSPSEDKLTEEQQQELLQAEEEAQEAEDAAKRAEEAAKAAEEQAQAAEDAAKAAEDAAMAKEQALQDQKNSMIPGVNRPIPTKEPTFAPTPTLAPTVTPPTATPTTAEPTTEAPVAWYENWEGTWSPTLWSETMTWAPTTLTPTTLEEKEAREQAREQALAAQQAQAAAGDDVAVQKQGGE